MTGPRTCISCRHFRDQGAIDYQIFKQRIAEATPKHWWELLDLPRIPPAALFMPPPFPKPPHCARTDVVTGTGVWDHSSFCASERRGGACGPDGQFWEASAPSDRDAAHP